MSKIFKVLLCASIMLILLFFDYANGGGVVLSIKKLCCRVVCFVVGEIKMDKDSNIPVLLSEGTFLAVVVTILHILKRSQARDKIDSLLAKSREEIKQTDDLLEKWRIGKVNYETANDYSYLDEELQSLQPYKLEVPILHMAIVEATGGRNKFERGDAADMMHVSDTTLLSVTSLFDDDLSTLSDERATNFDERETILDEKQTNDLRLWDVTEENNFDEL